MTGIIILIVLIIAFVVIHAITKDSVIKLPVLYAGTPNDAVNVKDIPLPKNDPIPVKSLWDAFPRDSLYIVQKTWNKASDQTD